MPIKILLIPLFLLIYPVFTSIADIIVLKSGGNVASSKAWEEGNEVRFYFGDQISSLPKSDVVEIRTETSREEKIIKRNPRPTELAQSVSLEIIRANRHGNIKCSLDVKLSQKVSSDALRQIALDLRGKETHRYDRMFINYYLPGMSPDTSDAWATSHFNPDLQVKILGLTADQERTVKNRPRLDDEVGIWVDELIGHTITIRRTPSGLILQNSFKNGKGFNVRLNERKVGSKTVFIEEGNKAGEYFMIDNSGNLGVYDPDGLITSMRSIR